LDVEVEALGQVIAGGALIGVALALLRLLTGRVMSVSGMLGTLLSGGEGRAAASITFMAGVFISPAIWIGLGLAASEPVEASWSHLAIGGMLVGFGARLARSGLVGTIWGSVQRSRWAAAALGAMAVGIAVSLLSASVLGGAA
jgi:hypothetical protein